MNELHEHVHDIVCVLFVYKSSHAQMFFYPFITLEISTVFITSAETDTYMYHVFVTLRSAIFFANPIASEKLADAGEF